MTDGTGARDAAANEADQPTTRAKATKPQRLMLETDPVTIARIEELLPAVQAWAVEQGVTAPGHADVAALAVAVFHEKVMSKVCAMRARAREAEEKAPTAMH